MTVHNRPEEDVTLEAESVRIEDANGDEVSVTGNGRLEIAVAEDTLNGLTVSDDGSFTIQSPAGGLDVSGATVPTEQQTPVALEDSSGSAVDPLDEQAIGPLEQSTATAEPGSIDLGAYITDVDVFLDLSAVNADYVFEVSQDDTNWREHTRVAQADLSTGGEFFQFDTSFQFTRSRYLGADADVTTHETSAKGVS